MRLDLVIILAIMIYIVGMIKYGIWVHKQKNKGRFIQKKFYIRTLSKRRMGIGRVRYVKKRKK